MHRFPALRQSAWLLLASATLLLCSLRAHATDIYTGTNLTIPTLAIGSARYSNVAVTVATIVTLPSGSAPNGSVDSYDPSTQLLTVQSVVYGGQTYYNAVVKVGHLVSIGSVSGADTYAAGTLTIAAVLVGSSSYSNVEVTVAPGNIVKVSGGMPQAATDQYTPSSGLLLIPAVQVGLSVYTNVTVAITLSDVKCIHCGAGAGYWIPFGEAGAFNGFGVLPSNLSSSTLTQVSTTGTEVSLGVLYSLAISGDTLTGLTPYAQLFAASGSDGKFHLYNSQLASSVTAATPVPFGGFSVPASDTLCTNTQQGYANYADPSTAFVLLSVYTAAQVQTDPNVCSDNSAPGANYLVQLKGTVPVSINNIVVTDSVIETNDASARMTGLVAFDTSGNMNFYPAVNGQPSFASPALIAANVTDSGSYDTIPLPVSGGGSQSFILVTANPTTTPVQQLWRVLSNGAASLVFSTTTGTVNISPVNDANNYYFDVVTPGTAGLRDDVYAVSLATGKPTLLVTSTKALTLIDSDGPRLFVEYTTVGSHLLSVPTSLPSGFTSLWAVANSTLTSVELDHATDQLFLNSRDNSGVVSAEVLSATGHANLPAVKNMQFIGIGASTVSGVILSATNITAIDGTTGGGIVNSTNTTTFLSTPIKLNGSAFQIPTGTNFIAVPLTQSLAVGLDFAVASGEYSGIVIDLATDTMVQTTPGTTALIPLY